MDQNPLPIKPKSPWFIVLLGIIVLVLAFTCLWLGLNTTPIAVYIPPPPTTPYPNALDYYLKADELLTAARMPLATPMVIPSKVPVGPFKGPPAAMPAARPTPIEQPWNAISTTKFTPQQLVEVLTVTQPALAKLREGFAYQYLAPPCRSFSYRYLASSKQRDLARYLNFAGATLAAQGHWREAVDCDLDALRLGCDPPQHSGIMGLYLGASCQLLGREHIWDALAHLTAAQARAATARMQDIISRQTNLPDILLEDKWETQAGLLELFGHANWHKELESMTAGMDADSEGNNRAMVILKLYCTSKRELLTQYGGYMDKLIAEANKPYRERNAISYPPGVMRLFCSIPEYAGDKVVMIQTENALLLTAFALQCYKAEHGGYPATLVKLVPAYLPKIPDDPFTHRAELRYKLHGEKYLLCSIGPDGKDDGGRPIEHASEKGKAHYVVFLSGSHGNGDIVAGVNLF